MVNSVLISLMFVLSISMTGYAPGCGSAELPSSCIDAFLKENLPENFVYSADLANEGRSPPSRG